MSPEVKLVTFAFFGLAALITMTLAAIAYDRAETPTPSPSTCPSR